MSLMRRRPSPSLGSVPIGQSAVYDVAGPHNLPALWELLSQGEVAMQAETDIPPDVARVALVRRWARERLTDAGLDESTLDALVLLVSESVTNAVVHARPPLVLCLDVDAERTRVEVRDGTSAEPVLRQTVPTQQGGRGMMFIDHLSSRWGTVTHDAEVGKPAKTVWFELTHPHATELPRS